MLDGFSCILLLVPVISIFCLVLARRTILRLRLAGRILKLK